jgi:hypothetical protein
MKDEERRVLPRFSHFSWPRSGIILHFSFFIHLAASSAK